ncbi:hypothetical protein BDR03DRAFT_982457 [Suillus americanus]|nr:hypothetical protein BDR03DRAFT_982457 [Suillus americanus]
MLDSFEKEIVQVGEQDCEDEEEASEDGKGSQSNEVSADQSDNVDSEENSESEVDKSNSASEDDKPSHKKQRRFKLDLSNLTDPSVVRRSKKLPVSLRKTNSILANWAHDPKQVKRKWLESAFITWLDLFPLSCIIHLLNFWTSRSIFAKLQKYNLKFPESELYNIIRGRVVNFDVVFSGWYSDEPEHDHEEKLGKFKIKVGGESEPAKTVRSSQDWNVAYSLFARAMQFAFPHRLDELDDYGNFIHQKFAQNVSKYHSCVIAFDKAVRKRVSRRRDLQLSDFDQFSDLYEGHFSLSGCYTNDEGSLSGLKHWRGVDYCKRWNYKTCSRSDSSCNYRHVCARCRSSEHPEKSCPSRSSN